MNEGAEAIARWLEQKRRKDRIWTMVIGALALSFGAAVFLLTTLLIYSVIRVVSIAYEYSEIFSEVVALGLTTWSYARIMKRRRHQLDLELDPMGLWIFKDIYSVGPRLLLEGLHEIRCCAQLGELNVAACARALAYLARKNGAVAQDELMSHCTLPWERLREQLLLLDGVLFVGEDGSRVTLMEPFRLLLRSMLPQGWQTTGKRQEAARPRPESAPEAAPVNEPEKLSAYEILGLSPSASWTEIRTAYRKRVKACHPDLFAGTDEQGRALAERWTKALNAAYATLNPRQRGTTPGSSRGR
jgi:DnaJ-domain-containing protein 1